jgi:hypothetical protein
MKGNIQHSTFNIQRRRIAGLVLAGCWKLNVQCSMFSLAMVFLAAALPLHGQTNVSEANAPLKLLPPYGELPPTFFEQHGTFIIFGGLGIVALAAVGGGLIFRPKPKVIIAPEVQARQALELLRQQPEDGAVLSRVSQVVQNYFIKAFQLASGEFTTAEFSRIISSQDQIGTELSSATAGFLRDCDACKFSTSADSAKLDAANRALNLIEQAEQRRVQHCQPAETQTQGRRV